VALYLLFCLDKLRGAGQNFVQFSVSLKEWIKVLAPGLDKRNRSASKQTAITMTVNFIQVCRDYFRGGIKQMASQMFLQHLYNSA